MKYKENIFRYSVRCAMLVRLAEALQVFKDLTYGPKSNAHKQSVLLAITHF